MRFVLPLTMLFFSVCSMGQIIKEKVYLDQQVQTAKITDSELIYWSIPKDPAKGEIIFYDMSHRVIHQYKPKDTLGYKAGAYVLYPSRFLFDKDTGIEFVIVYTHSNYNAAFAIIDDDRSIDHWFEHRVLRQIFEANDTTKMALGFRDNAINPTGALFTEIYSLPGSLPTPVEEPFLEGHVQVYPNPVSNNVTIEYSLPANEKQGEILIYDLNGKMMESISVGQHFTTVQLNVSSYSRGVYIASLNGKNLKKIVVN